MRKKILTVTAVVVLATVAVWLLWNLTDCATLRLGDKSTELSFSESWQVRLNLIPKQISLGGYCCPFSEKMSFRMGELSYWIASDGCESVYIPELNLYYTISQDNMKALRKLFSQ